jgi:hypothetical protein
MFVSYPFLHTHLINFNRLTRHSWGHSKRTTATWLRINNRAVTQFDLAELLGNALLKCQTTELAVNGFRETGVCPLNKHVFTDTDYCRGN